MGHDSLVLYQVLLSNHGFPGCFACDNRCVYNRVRDGARRVIQVLLEKCSVMGSSWYFDEATDDPGQSSLDNISFNGQLVNAVGRMIYAGKLKGSHDQHTQL